MPKPSEGFIRFLYDKRNDCIANRQDHRRCQQYRTSPDVNIPYPDTVGILLKSQKRPNLYFKTIMIKIKEYLIRSSFLHVGVESTLCDSAYCNLPCCCY